MRAINLKDEQGSTIIIALILIVVLSTLGFTLLRSSLADYKFANNHYYRTRAYYIARSGAELVANWVENNDETKVIGKTSDEVKLDEGYFTVIINKLGNGNLSILSTGTFNGVDNSARLVLERAIPYLDMAAYVDTYVNMSGSSQIIGDIGSNTIEDGTFVLEGNPILEGYINILKDGIPEEVVSVPNWGNLEKFSIKGINEMDNPRNYDLPDFPEYPDDLFYRGDHTAGYNSDEEDLIISSNGEYDSLMVKNKLTIEVGDEDRIIRVKDFSVEGNAEVEIDKTGDGNLYMYVEDTFNLSGSSTINADGNLEDLYMYYKGDQLLDYGGATQFNGSVYAEKADIKLRGSGGILGNILTGGNSVEIVGDATANVRALYAPEANVDFTGSGKLKGAVVANKVDLTGNARIEYDTSIADTFSIEGFFENSDIYTLIWKDV